MSLISGGHLVNARVFLRGHMTSRRLSATDRLAVHLSPAVADLVTQGTEPLGDLPCLEGALLRYVGFPVGGHVGQQQQQAAAALVRRMRRAKVLTVASPLVTSALVAALPSTVRDVIVVNHTDACSGNVRMLMDAPGLRTVTVPFSLGDASPAELCVEVQQTAKVPAPVMHVPPLGCWDLRRLGPPPGGVAAHCVRLTGESLAAVPPEPSGWTRGVLALALPSPLGPAFWDRAAGLAAVFPNVSTISARRSPDSGAWLRDLDALRDLCVAIGPRLRRVDGLDVPDLRELQDASVVAACPWLSLA